jgi:hypothetical protein
MIELTKVLRPDLANIAFGYSKLSFREDLKTLLSKHTCEDQHAYFYLQNCAPLQINCPEVKQLPRNLKLHSLSVFTVKGEHNVVNFPRLCPRKKSQFARCLNKLEEIWTSLSCPFIGLRFADEAWFPNCPVEMRVDLFTPNGATVPGKLFRRSRTYGNETAFHFVFFPTLWMENPSNINRGDVLLRSR